jgi:threonine/homoserine/homoserine lactone efflux protein
LGVLTLQSGTAFLTVKWLGAAYLAWIGVSTFRSHPATAREENQMGRRGSLPGAGRAILGGFLTNALNPKAALFFLALFSVVVSPLTPLGVRALYCVWMALATFMWFACVSHFFAREGVRRAFLKLGPWIGRTLGAAFLALAVRLALSAAR